jgi:hypothetical protein
MFFKTLGSRDPPPIDVVPPLVFVDLHATSFLKVISKLINFLKKTYLSIFLETPEKNKRQAETVQFIQTSTKPTCNLFMLA